MWIELGHFCLILAFGLAVLQVALPAIGVAQNKTWLMTCAKRLALGQACFLILASAALLHGLVQNDFSVEYIARHSNSAMPLMYRVSAFWGGHEGSLLLWTLFLSFWMVAVSLGSRDIPLRRYALVHVVMGAISCGFISFMLLTSNPFQRLLPAAMEGAELNPLLQDPALAIHPPMLYMGYVGFSIAFSFAIAALIDGKVDDNWTKWVRPWTLTAWSFLTIGIALGSWWAYYELGWGGWWFWDPVENASFMPWLAGTALIHSLAVTDTRSIFKHWTVLLSILAFSLSLLGTFLVRSGVLTSVHAFATDPARGVYILAFLGIVVGTALSLYAWRAPSLSAKKTFSGVSRESGILLNNAFVIVTLGTVMLGTLYPLVLDAFGAGKISVGPPYFNRVFVPLMLLVMVFLGVGPFLNWRKASIAVVKKTLAVPAAISVICGVAVPFAFGEWKLWAAIGVALAVWTISSTVLWAFKLVTSGRQFQPSIVASWGMITAHIGVGLFAFGVTISSLYSEELETRLAVGEEFQLQGRVVTLARINDLAGPNYQATEAVFEFQTGAGKTIELSTQKRFYPTSKKVMTEAGIEAGLWRHLYVALGEPVGRNWGVRAYYKPCVEFIWLGAFTIALGGAISTLGRRLAVLLLAQSTNSTSQGVPTVDGVTP